MMLILETICALMTREVRLLARNRARLLSLLAVPLAGGIVCGWMTRTTSLPPVYCLIVFLMLSAIIVAADQDTRASHAVSAIAGRRLFAVSWTLAALMILLTQTALLTTCASLIGGFQVPIGVLAGTIILSLALSAAMHRVLSIAAL